MMLRNFIRICLFAVLLSCIDFSLQAQNLTRGDNLNFSYGLAGWQGKGGSYAQSSTSAPVWNWTNTYTQINTATDGSGTHLFEVETDTNAYDPYTNGQLKKVPTQFGFTRSLKINNNVSSNTPSCALAAYDLLIEEDNCLLSIYYSIVLEAPSHGGYEDPTFQIDVVLTGTETKVNDCALFEMQGHTPIPQGSPFQIGSSGSYGSEWMFCPWQQVKINLANYIGESVTVRVRISDCKYEYHAGYGYICCKAEKPTIEVAGCAGMGDTITTATAPDGFESYKWFRVTRTANSQASLGNQEPTDDSEILSTDRVFAITEDMMQGQNTQYFAVKLISPRTQTTRPNCVAYIKATVNDIRPNFDAVSYIGVDPMNPRDEIGFKFSEVIQRNEASPLVEQAIAFGDGDSVAFVKDSETWRWSVSDSTPISNGNTRIVIDPASQSIDTVYHVYIPGTYTAKRYATSAYEQEDEEGNQEYIYCTRNTDIRFTVSERPSLLLEASDPICMGAGDTIYASSPDNEETLANTYQYFWWKNYSDTTTTPLATGKQLIVNDIMGDTTFVVKVLDPANGFYRFGEITIHTQLFPEISLNGDTMLCMGQTANIEASDATGNTEAMQWSFVNPGPNPRITNPSTNPILSFMPTQDTVVYLICETSAGCIASKSVNIIMTNPKVSADKLKVCPFEEVTLTGSNALDYSWRAEPMDVSLTEDVRSEEPVVVTPETTTTYTMRGFGSSGCYTERQITVTVVPVPLPVISYTPAYVDAEDPTVSFNDASLYGAYSLWRFSDGGVSNDRTMRYQFKDLSVDSVTVYLKSANEIGQAELLTNDYNCSADTSLTLPVELFAVWVPSAFSPNGDGKNDYFFFQSFNYLEDVVFEVYNRWGTKLYSFEEPAFHLLAIDELMDRIGWDGTYGGKLVQDGVYVWKLRYRRQGNTRVYQKTGTVMVVK
ncbi:MAG: gliding motility-associated C-terminal domain-containing protein [Bacteroidales bacterium]|nr:gliding motility-associated C-terminal domain-containing protein [Bacteroidales bacterium]